MRHRLLLAFALLVFSSVASAQVTQFDPEYLETLYGPIADVSLTRLRAIVVERGIEHRVTG